MKRNNSQSKNWQHLIHACQLASFSKIYDIIFENGQPVSIGNIEESVLLKSITDAIKPSSQDYELKSQWINFIKYAQKRGDFTIDILFVQNGLPEKVDTKRPDISRMFSQVR